MKSKYLVFLDIDGVLTSNRVHVAHNSEDLMWQRFDPVAIDFFNFIHDTYPVEFVIMSSWIQGCDAKNTSIEHWVRAAFASAGLRGMIARPWRIDPDNEMMIQGLYDRAYGVKHYLETFGKDAEDFILFDDSQYEFEKVLGKKRLIWTDCNDGLLFKHMLNAKSMMGTWNEK